MHILRQYPAYNTCHAYHVTVQSKSTLNNYEFKVYATCIKNARILAARAARQQELKAAGFTIVAAEDYIEK